MKKMEILVEEKTENQVKKRKFVKVKKNGKKAETITPAFDSTGYLNSVAQCTTYLP